MQNQQEILGRIGSFHLVELVYTDLIEFIIKKDNDNYFWLERVVKDNITGHPYSCMKNNWFSGNIIMNGVEIIDHGVAGTMTLLLLEKEDRDKLFS